ncbi:MAG: hypothetical protein J3K34DRAFT_422502 [Monoraphidium minutum]|nr:MAG: hypothetical protein J3K34DRAFT_422502 [Monoraphidium minutum]
MIPFAFSPLSSLPAGRRAAAAAAAPRREAGARSSLCAASPVPPAGLHATAARLFALARREPGGRGAPVCPPARPRVPHPCAPASAPGGARRGAARLPVVAPPAAPAGRLRAARAAQRARHAWLCAYVWAGPGIWSSERCRSPHPPVGSPWERPSVCIAFDAFLRSIIGSPSRPFFVSHKRRPPAGRGACVPCGPAARLLAETPPPSRARASCAPARSW